MQARAGGAPFVFAVPGKSLAQRFGDAPSVGISEPGEHGPRRCHAERLDELLPEEPERDGIEQEHAFASERDEPALRNEMQQFVNIEVGGAHEALREGHFKMRVKPIISIVFDELANRRVDCK